LCSSRGFIASLVTLACALASLLVPGIASASTVTGAETRVWAFDLADQVDVGVERSLTPDLRPGCEVAYDEIASDSLLAPRGGPKPNGGDARPHGGPAHNQAIDDRVGQLQGDKSVKDIRKNQVQVDADGNRVGNNRPDVQYDRDGVHHNVEYDTNQRSSDRHRSTIERNDPNAKNEFNRVGGGS